MHNLDVHVTSAQIFLLHWLYKNFSSILSCLYQAMVSQAPEKVVRVYLDISEEKKILQK